MKKLFFAILCCAGLFYASTAQVSLQPNIPTVGLLQKNQLWNVLVVNNTNTNYECRLSLVLRDRITGQELLTATSSLFTLLTGAKQLNANALSPIQYNNLQTSIDNKLQGLLPAGTYIACYSLLASGQKEISLADECLPFDAEPLSPPMLISPADSAVLEVAPAQFSWIPPTPEGMFNGLHYEVLIAEVNEGQKAAEAVQENLPFYNEGNQQSTILNYPSSNISFQKEKWYAWQIVARDNNNYAGKSEVWVFKVITDPVEEIIKMAPYIKVASKANEVTTLHQGILKMEYYNFLTDSSIQIFIYDEKQGIKQSQKIDIKIAPGQNYIQFDLYKKTHLSENIIYEAELINSRNEKFFIKFRPKNYR